MVATGTYVSLPKICNSTQSIEMSANRMWGVSLDFKAMSHYGINSNCKILSNKASKSQQNYLKRLEKLYECDALSYWTAVKANSRDMSLTVRGNITKL